MVFNKNIVTPNRFKCEGLGRVFKTFYDLTVFVGVVPRILRKAPPGGLGVVRMAVSSNDAADFHERANDAGSPKLNLHIFLRLSCGRGHILNEACRKDH